MSRELRRLLVKDLRANPRNIRDRLEDIDELAASIRVLGIMQPLVVNDRAGSLEVTDGHRRLAAAQRLKIERVVCIVDTDADDRQVLSQMIASAMHQQLKPIEQAKAFERLRREGMTTLEISRATGHAASHVRLRLALLELPLEAQQLVEDKALTIGQANDLAQQVKRQRTGSTSAGVTRQRARDVLRTHPLAAKFALACPHQETRQEVGAGACIQCIERVIREDEREQLAREEASCQAM